jgi:hypothetical protein
VVLAAGLSFAVVAITLVAAVLHAVWNAVAHAISDRLVGFALIGLAYVVVGGVGGVGVLVLGPPPAGAWPFVVASAAVHVVYTLLLWLSYQLGDFSQTYPIARGTAPFVVAVVEIALGHELPVLQLAGILVISMGLVSLALQGGRLSRSALPAVGTAIATGVAIAGYTVIDATAVASTPVLVYAAWMFLLQGPVLPVIAALRRGRGPDRPGPARPDRRLWRRTRLAGGLRAGVGGADQRRDRSGRRLAGDQHRDRSPHRHTLPRRALRAGPGDRGHGRGGGHRARQHLKAVTMTAVIG